MVGSALRVLAMDLSLTASGLALPDGQLDTYKPLRGLTGTPRLGNLRDGLCTLVHGVHADIVALEGYAYGASGSAVVSLGELGGVIRLALHDLRVPFVDVAPAALKRYATGHGNASKDEVLVAAVKRLGVEPKDSHQAEAAWLRCMALDAYHRSPWVTGVDLLRDSRVPQHHREALKGVTWPELERDRW